MKKIEKNTLIKILGVLLFLIIGVFVIRNGMIENDVVKAINQTWTDTINNQDNPKYLEKITTLSSYEVVDVKKDKDVYLVNVTVNGIDLGKMLMNTDENTLQKKQTEEEINNYLLSLIDKSNKVQTNTVLYAEPIEKGYKVYFSDEFIDAMSGKVYSYSQNLINKLIGE